MQDLSENLSHLFHYVDSISMICLISLEDFDNVGPNSPNLHKRKILEDIEHWCQKTIQQLKVFMENKKFIHKKTCLCEECIEILDNYDISMIYDKILKLIPKSTEILKNMDVVQTCLSRNDKVYMKRLSKLLYDIQFDIQMEILRESILFTHGICKCDNDE